VAYWSEGLREPVLFLVGSASKRDCATQDFIKPSMFTLFEKFLRTPLLAMFIQANACIDAQKMNDIS